MTAIDHVTLEVADLAAADRFHEALGVADRVHTTQASDAPPTGFRGFTLSVVVGQPGDADRFVASATAAGATVVQAPKKSLWGYGGTVQAPDGTIWTVASSSKKDSGPPSSAIESFVLQLGVADVAVSRDFYTERGFAVAKSFGRKYVEFDTGRITLTLNKRAGLAKVAGVADEGAGHHGVVLPSAAGPFTDPDGFAWV